MELGMIGLGRMGGNMALKLMRGGHRVVTYARRPEALTPFKAEGATPALSLEELVGQLKPPRHVWIMVPSGDPVSAMIDSLSPLLKPGDVLIDGGNSNYRDSIARAERLSANRLRFMDVGTSGGIWGLKGGYCMMAGGEEEVFRRIEPLFQCLAAPSGAYAHFGPHGAGHYVKMIHNGIEYGMLQSYAEGFELLDASQYEIDMLKVAQVWNHGSVVRSWLLELAERALEEDPDLSELKGYVEDSGEGRWTIQEAIDRDVPATVLAHSLFVRFRSRQKESFGAKLIAALRQEFGGHRVQRE